MVVQILLRFVVIFVVLLCSVRISLSIEHSRDCPPSIEPLISLAGVGSFYRQDAGQSNIDPERAAEYYRLTWQYDALLKNVLSLSIEAAEGNNEAAVDCILDQLVLWANAEALTLGIAPEFGVERRQAAMIQAWVIVGTTTPLIEFRSFIRSDDVRFSAILTWMRRLALMIHNDFILRADRPLWLNAPTNHSHWAGLAEVRVGMLADDPGLFASGMVKLDRALDSISQDGSLPEELSRKNKALQYTNFAMLPIAGMLRAADQYNRDVTSRRWAALQRAVNFALDVNADPEILKKMTGLPQELLPLPERLSWLAVLLPILEKNTPELSRRAADVLANVQTAADIFYGLP